MLAELLSVFGIVDPLATVTEFIIVAGSVFLFAKYLKNKK